MIGGYQSARAGFKRLSELGIQASLSPASSIAEVRQPIGFLVELAADVLEA